MREKNIRCKHLKLRWFCIVIAVGVKPMQQKQQRFTRSLELVMQNSCDLVGVVHHANHVPFLQKNVLR